MRIRFHFWGLIISCSVFISCSTEDNNVTSVESDENKVYDITNNSETLSLSVATALVGSEENEEFLFADVTDIAVGEGYFLVLDRGFRQLRFYSNSESTQTELMSSFEYPNGSGPGEFTDVYSISLERRTKNVILSFPYGVAILDSTFREIMRFPVSSEYVKVHSISEGELLIAKSPRLTPDRCCLLEIYDYDIVNREAAMRIQFGNKPDTYDWTIQNRISDANNVYATVNDRVAYMAHSYPYEIQSFSIDSGEALVQVTSSSQYYEELFEDVVSDVPISRIRNIIGGIEYSESTGLLVFESSLNSSEGIPFDSYIRAYSDELVPTKATKLIGENDAVFTRLNRMRVFGGMVLLSVIEPYPGVYQLEYD